MISPAEHTFPLTRPFFYLAATYNLVIGGLMLATTSAPVNDRIVGLLVLCFGIVYALVGWRPDRFGPVHLEPSPRMSYITDNA